MAVLAVGVSAAVLIAPLARPNEPAGAFGRWLAAQRLQPDDVIELPCGGRWDEGLTLTASIDLAVRAAPGCATRERPLLQPMQQLRGWRREGADLYSVASDPPQGLVMVNGELLPPVKYPAVGFLQTASALSRAEINLAGGAWITVRPEVDQAGVSFKGATVHVRNHPWIIETGSVDSHEGARLRVTGLVHDVPAGALLSVSGQRWMLDDAAARGWAWDGPTRRLYLRLSPGIHPAEADVRIASAAYGISADGARRLRLSGFDIVGAGADGVKCERCANVEIDDIHIDKVGRDGVNLSGVDGADVRRLQVRHAARDGIGLVGSARVRLVNSVFVEIGTGGWPQSSRAAINGTRSSDLVALDNRILRAGYIGIRLNRASRISHNEIIDSCTALDDCGAIYSWADADGQPLQAEISENLVRGVHGLQAGSPERYTLAAGIYLDDLSSKVTVRGNTVLDAERGLMLHNASNNDIERNIFAASRAYAVVIDMGHPRIPGDRMPANRITGNAIVTSRGERAVLVLDRKGRAVRDLFAENSVVSPTAGSWLQWQRGGDSRLLAPETGNDTPFETNGNRFIVGRAHVFAAGPEAKQWPCPAEVAACDRVRDTSGQPVVWPLALPRFTTRWVLLGAPP